MLLEAVLYVNVPLESKITAGVVQVKLDHFAS